MNIIVLGAGVVGVTSAWYLAAAGHKVTVLEGKEQVADDTSFANGGQISVSHAEPWANPHVLPRLLRWLGREDAPLLWRWRRDWAQWKWGARFLRECLPGRTRHNVAAIVNLAIFSRSQLQALRQAENLNYDQRTRGILHLYSSHHELKHAERAVKLMCEFGLDRHVIGVDECLRIEPTLAQGKHLLVGGDYTPSDESGDAHLFTSKLAELAQQKFAVRFCFGQHIERLVAGGSGQIAGVVVKTDEDSEAKLHTADAYVVALGSYSPQLLNPLGIKLPIYPAKGYSITLHLSPGCEHLAPQVSLTDDEKKLVFSRLGQRLRVAGTAEFNGFNRELNNVRCQNLLQRTRQWFPELSYENDPNFWCGLRPATPSNLPYIGRLRYKNLWLNTGHGTLGWTLSCGSAAILARLVDGQRPQAVFPNLAFPFLC